ncbi:MAG: hypothetical protein OEL84_12040 [Nitrosopumilus sp.]|nr:hypothetical protein [Nitrosopumilus sp.]
MMDGELHRKIKEAKSLYEKYVQMMDEHVVKKNMMDNDFNRRIMKVYHCMINAYDEINQNIGLSHNK